MDPQHYYDRFADGYERERAKPYHRMIDELEVGVVERYGLGLSVLEVGCGTGLVLSRIAEFASRAEGVDISEGMLATARRRGLSVQQASATQLPFADNEFDVVCSFKVLAHVEDIGAALQEFARVVRPGGWVLAEFYNKRSLRYLIKKLKKPTPVAEGVDDEQVFTRYDDTYDMKKYLPASLTWVTSRGIRVVTPSASIANLPGVGGLLAKVERSVCDIPGLRECGGFYVVCAQKMGG